MSGCRWAERESGMRSGENIVEQRDEWVARVCEVLIGPYDEHPAFGAVETVPELGDPGLTCALLVARIAALTANGSSVAEVVEILVHDRNAARFRDDLTDLVKKVWWQIEWDGVVGSDRVNCGLRGWSPESTYRLMLELWSAHRRASTSDDKLKRELVRRWGIDDPDWLETCRTRRPNPLLAFPDTSASLHAESDVRAANLAAYGVGGSELSAKAWDWWSSRLAFGILDARHLFAVGGDLVRWRQAQQVLRPVGDPDLHGPMSRAIQIIEDGLGAMAEAVDGLSTLERELLGERSDEINFQECCLATVVRWSCYGTGLPRFVETYGVQGSWGDGADAAHGLWGPLPWWVITVLDGDQERAARATLREGTLPLGIEQNSAASHRLTLVVRRPRTGEPGLRASFMFDLTNPAHAGELLLIGRRGGVCVDLVRVPDYDSMDPDDDDVQDLAPTELGTVSVEAGGELARLLIERASQALQKFVSEEWESNHQGEIQSLQQALEGCGRPAVGSYSPSKRRVRVTAHERRDDGIVLETDDPPSATTDFGPLRFKIERSPKIVSPPRPSRAQDAGFVYVLRNPGIPGMLKIGFSHRLSEDRADELFSTAVPFPFEVLYRAYTSRPRDVEQAVHRLLAAHRVAANREFFRVSLESAKEAIRHCQELVTGIESWDPLPEMRLLHAGDRVVLPLKDSQLLILTAFSNILAPNADVVDLWQAHSDGDLLELHLTYDAGQVHGLSDSDPDGVEDPVPYLNRDKSAPNGWLHGRERLTPGDRLSWLSHPDAAHKLHVVFEICDPCQVTYRTWNPQKSPEGSPMLLNFVTRTLDEAVKVEVRKALTLGVPRSWAPRNPDSAEWVQPASRSTGPEDWLPQLRPRRGRGRPPSATAAD